MEINLGFVCSSLTVTPEKANACSLGLLVIFKINIVKLIDKHPKLMKSSVTLGFLKTCYKNIKHICNENPNEFE